MRSPLFVLAALVSLLFPSPGFAAVVLQYHHISTETPPSTSTSPERFAMHLDYLAEQGFEVMDLQALVEAVRDGRELPDRAAAITFDDGYRSIYEVAYPMLKERGWTFTVFINTEPHDRGQSLFMSWAQLKEMKDAGVTIANHTVSHASLIQRQPGQSNADWKEWAGGEIRQAQQRIEQQLGAAPRMLAYPYGEFDRQIRELVAELGFIAFGQHSGPLASHSDPQALPRFPFGGHFGDAQDFATKVNSLPMPLAPGPGAIAWFADNGKPLADMVMPGPTARPVLELQFEDDFNPVVVNCFATRQGRIEPRVEGSSLRVQAPQAFSVGRSRYNCTAGSGQLGRFFWFSQQWIVRPVPNDAHTEK